MILGDGINLKRGRFISQDCPRARPLPFQRIIHQSLSHRIQVDVIDHKTKRSALRDIPVKSSTRLPKHALAFPGSNARDSWNPSRRVLFDKVDRTPRDRGFEGFANRGDVVGKTARMENEMNMVWHEDIGPIATSSIVVATC